MANDLPHEGWVYDEDIRKISDLVQAIEDTKRIWKEKGGRFILRGSLDQRGRSDEVIEGKAQSIERPLIIMAESIGGATVEGSGSLRLKNVENIWLYGINFEHETPDEESSVVLENASRCRIARCNFHTKLRPRTGKYHYLRIGRGTDTNLIDHNIFHDKERSLGCFLVLGGHESSHTSKNTVIERNYFCNHPGAGSNGGEALRVGESSLKNKSFNSDVRFNLFEKCNGDPECISNKSRDNVYQYNTFRGNDGSLCFRHGYGITVKSNVFEGCQRGIRIHGKDNEVFDNYFKNVPVGDLDEEKYFAIIIENGRGSSYLPVETTNIKNNIIEKTDQECRRLIQWGSSRGGTIPKTTTFQKNIIIVKKGKVIRFRSGISAATLSKQIRNNKVYYLRGERVDVGGLSEDGCKKEDVSAERLREISEKFEREGLKPADVGPSSSLSDYTFDDVKKVLGIEKIRAYGFRRIVQSNAGFI